MLTQDKPIVQAPQVWDKPTALAQVGDYIRVAPIMRVVERKSLSDGRVWLLVKPSNASADPEEWVVEPESSTKEQQQPEQEPQPVGFAGDSVGVGLQPTEEAITEFSQGRAHGQQDAADRLHAMYAAPSDQYAAGYLSGYNNYINPSPQPEVIEPPRWSVQYDPNWDWYRVWVGDRCIGHGTDYQQAERIAQRYIGAEQFWQQHRQAVLAGYAC